MDGRRSLPELEGYRPQAQIVFKPDLYQGAFFKTEVCVGFGFFAWAENCQICIDYFNFLEFSAKAIVMWNSLKLENHESKHKPTSD